MSSVRFKCKPGYWPCDLLWIKCSHWLKLQHSDWRANLVKDNFEKNKVSTNENTWIITGHMIYNLAYISILQTTTTYSCLQVSEIVKKWIQVQTITGHVAFKGCYNFSKSIWKQPNLEICNTKKNEKFNINIPMNYQTLAESFWDI